AQKKLQYFFRPNSLQHHKFFFICKKKNIK
ncbi:hypothetical protein, partial [Plasmodium yoelii yoelii]